MVESVAPRKPWLLALNAALAAIGLGLAALSIMSVLNSPYTGMRAASYVIVWVLGALGFNRAFALAQGWVHPGAVRTTLRIAKWLLPWFLPIGLIVAVESQVMARQREGVERELAPVIAHADAQAPGAFSSDGAPPIAFPVPVRFGETETGYVLWLQAASIDIDGFVYHYDSNTRRWTQTHNDSLDATMLPQSRCTLERRAWRCIEPEPPQVDVN